MAWPSGLWDWAASSASSADLGGLAASGPRPCCCRSGRCVCLPAFARCRAEVRAGCEEWVGCDQVGRVLGVDEPGGVSAGHLIEPGAVNLLDRSPCLLDG